ncbi:glycosyltransferase family 4 protein [Tamlana crocina]|uniref:Glycosyltransferase family 4 protein n=1 Tax=Tamlana crocina TaxID=393006 RepID=A0ABX1DEV2_9FLAO|nr:glycosyltransferase family 4 protein [Tamlana crocina]NJX15163.1 glycosyltransferase family 4 protein [Tamlana crocina]
MKKKFLIVSTISTTLNFFEGQVKFLNNYFDVELVTSPDDVLDFVSKREGVKVHPVKMMRDISPIQDLKSLYRLVMLFKKIKPHVVHGNTPKGGLLSMTAAWLTRVPVRIYYIHGLRFEGDAGLKRKILLSIERMSCYFATDIIAVSHGVKKNLKEQNITSKTPYIIGNGSANGINGEVFSVEAVDPDQNTKNQIRESDIVFGYVGRLVKDKGVNELVRVFSQLNKMYKNTKLLLVGWYEQDLDPLDKDVENEINENDNIIAVGGQNDVRPFLKLMDIFVFPSYREGFGVSVMEAAAMDLPIICSNITGCNEIVKHNYNGLLVDSKSESSLLEAMTYLLENPKQTDKLRQVTRKHILEKYNQQMVWQEAAKTYKTITEANFDIV